MAKRYYWLKLQKDFFKRPDIKIIESQPDGILYCYFYMKLLLESLEMQGVLRYNDVPLDVNMLSALTNTSPSVVKSAIDIFLKMNMIEILDDGALFLSEVALLLDSETEDARRKRRKKESVNILEEKTKKLPMTSTERVKKFREKQKLANSLEKNVTEHVTDVTKSVTKCNEKNVTCNENSLQIVTEKNENFIENKDKKYVTENFRKFSIEQEQDIEQDIYTCHDHERDIKIENIFKQLEINYTNTNLESTNIILKKLNNDTELLKEYILRFYEKTVKNAFNIQNKRAFFSAKLKEPDVLLINKLLIEKESKIEEQKIIEKEAKEEEEERKRIVDTNELIDKFKKLTPEMQEEIVKKAEKNKIRNFPNIAMTLEEVKNVSRNVYYRMLAIDIKEILLEENLI
nr:phage replisome organizer N-terminal domain-containing protein [uncultured Fusobacterium sp.]